MTHLGVTIIGSLSIAALSTIGDVVWATWIPRHRAIYGLTHGALLFLSIGLFFGTLAGRASTGAVAGAFIGAAAAAAFYLLAPLAGYSAMFLVWTGVWVALGVLYARLGGGGRGTRAGMARGAIAAVASGLAFFAVSGIWRPFDPVGWDYAVHFGAWTCAYFPGFAALLLARPGADAPSPSPVGGPGEMR